MKWSEQARTFGIHLRTLRITKKIGVTELARKLGVTRQQVRNWEVGYSEPVWGVACRIADALGVDIGTFRGENNGH
jgi:DNA-binding XRE family transcriptional regulator